MAGTILLVGANRGLGLGLAREYLRRGWDVVATARHPGSASELVALEGNLRVEAMDMSRPAQAAELAARLKGTSLDVLFIVAGQNKGEAGPIHEVSREVAGEEFLVNSYAPPVAAEALLGLLKPGGTVVFMTSILGSLASNRPGVGMELYNASKAALNMMALGFAGRHPDRRVVLMHPGWVKTDMGGPDAPLDVATSVRGMADTVAARAAGTGVVYVDYAGEELPW